MKINVDNKGVWFSNDGSSGLTDFNIDPRKVNFNNNIGYCAGGSFNASPAAYTAGLTMGYGSDLHWIRTGLGPGPR